MEAQVALNDISSQIANLYKDQETPGVRVHPATGGNFVIPVLEGSGEIQEAREIAQYLMEVRPGRVFIIVVSNRVTRGMAVVNGQCRILNDREHVCSEVIEIRTPVHAVRSILSILRVNFLSGQPSFLFAFDGLLQREWFENLVSICDQLVIDTLRYAGRTELFPTFANFRGRVIDARWIAMAPWREVVRAAFDNKILVQHLSELDLVDIHISGPSVPPMVWGIESVLMAGWLIDKLNLDILRFERNYLLLKPYAVSGQTLIGGEVKMLFNPGIVDGVAEITGLAFHFGRQLQLVVSRFKRGDSLEQLEATIKMQNKVVSTLSWPLPPQNLIGLLDRFHILGESTAGYRSAVRIALGLR